MKLKFFKKFFLTTTLIILASLALITVILSFFVSSYLTNEKLNTLNEICEAVVSASNELADHEINAVKSTKIFSGITDITEADIYIADANGKVVLCSCEDWEVDGICKHNKTAVSAEILEKVNTGDFSESGNLDGFFDSTYFTHAKPLKAISGEKNGYVFASLSPNDIQDFYKKILWMFFISAIVPIVIMFFAEYVIIKRKEEKI